MKKIDVSIHVFQNDMNITSQMALKYGKIFSTSKSIKVNNVNGEYSVLYKEDDFNELDQQVFTTNLLKLFFNNLKDSDILFTIEYHNNNGFRNLDCVAQILVFNEIMSNLKTSAYQNNNYVTYIMSESLKKLLRYVCNNLNLEDEDEDDDDYEESDDGDDDVLSTLNQILGGINDDDEDEDDDDYEKKKNKKSKKHYRSSRVLKYAKHPKRSYKRHGVIVANDKSDIKKDKKIIKEFLEDFIPGNSAWEKDLKRDLSKVIVYHLAITKKKLKENERKHRKKQQKQYRRRNPEMQTALEFAQRMINHSIDEWNDPSR